MSDWRSSFTNRSNNPEGWKRYEEKKQKRKLERLEKQKNSKKRIIKDMFERFVLDISFITTNGNMLERIKDFSVSFPTKTGKHKTDEDIVIERTIELIEEEYLQDGLYSIIEFDYEIIDYHRWEVS